MTVAIIPALIVLWVIVLFEGLIILGLVRTLGEIRVAAENGRLPQRLPVGARAPRLEGTDVRTGLQVDTADLSGREQIILFLSDNCPYCLRLADGTRAVPAAPGQSRVAICHGTVTRTQTLAGVLASDVALLADPDGAMFSAYGISSTPSAILVDDLGIVRGSGGPRHSGELAELVASVREPLAAGDQLAAATGS
jgi:peroxiredoxin